MPHFPWFCACRKKYIFNMVQDEEGSPTVEIPAWEVPPT